MFVPRKLPAVMFELVAGFWMQFTFGAASAAGAAATIAPATADANNSAVTARRDLWITNTSCGALNAERNSD
jgi:hypothetical protein